MNEPKPVHCRLSKPVRAVKLRDHPGSSLRSPTGNLVELPVDSVLQIEGKPAPSGLGIVLWNGEAFSVFYDDLRENGEFTDGPGGGD